MLLLLLILLARVWHSYSIQEQSVEGAFRLPGRSSVFPAGCERRGVALLILHSAGKMKTN